MPKPGPRNASTKPGVTRATCAHVAADSKGFCMLCLKKRSEKSVTSSTCHASVFHGSASFMHRVPSVTSNLCVSGDSACPCPSSDRLVQDSNAASASSMRGLQPARNRTL